MANNKKAQSEANIKKNILNEDPDSTVKFTLSAFPINDLLNSDSFISLYPDVLDIVFYNPEITTILEKFNTASGFVCSIKSLKQVNLGSWLGSAILGKKNGETEIDQVKAFLTKYVETQLFNGLLRNTVSDDDKITLDPQEYFDEVASACADAISKNIVSERVKPNMFNSSVEYSVYPISESVTRKDMLKNVGIVVTLAGNIGVEKVSGSLLKRGKVMVLVDITVKVIVFNTYIFSKRCLTMILNGIRERQRINRKDLLDAEIERQANDVTENHKRRWDVEMVSTNLSDRLLRTADNLVSEKLHDRVSSVSTVTTGGLNKEVGKFVSL